MEKNKIKEEETAKRMLTFKFCVLSSYLKCDFLNQFLKQDILSGALEVGLLI